jgi:hypothetical protein
LPDYAVLFAYPIALSCSPLYESHNESDESDENGVVEWIELIDRILRQNIGKNPYDFNTETYKEPQTSDPYIIHGYALLYFCIIQNTTIQ